MYEWRKMSTEKREDVLRLRCLSRVPWHSPPHYSEPGVHHYHLTGACYEHAPHIGFLPERMTEFEYALCETLSHGDDFLNAWCVLPNHWHALVRTADLKSLLSRIGKLHGRSSYEWNKLEGQSGRKCWHRCSDRRIRSDAHRFAVMNYIHHNPVKYGFVDRWEEWLFSSAALFLEKEGRERAVELWKSYPVKGIGRGWDE